MGGLLNIRVSAFARTLVTRAVAIVPTLLVALSFSTDSTGLDRMNQVCRRGVLGGEEGGETGCPGGFELVELVGMCGSASID